LKQGLHSLPMRCYDGKLDDVRVEVEMMETDDNGNTRAFTRIYDCEPRGYRVKGRPEMVSRLIAHLRRLWNYDPRAMQAEMLRDIPALHAHRLVARELQRSVNLYAMHNRELIEQLYGAMK